MTTFAPILTYERTVLGTMHSLERELWALTNGLPTSQAWPTANLAISLPVYAKAPFTPTALWWANGNTITGSTTVVMALYDETGTIQFCTTGSITQATANVPQSVTVAPGRLPRGRYWLSLVCGNNTSTFYMFLPSAAVGNIQKMVGMSEEARGATTLPSAITFGAAAQAMIPIMGINCSALAL